MDPVKELTETRGRLDVILAHLAGLSVTDIARQFDTSTPTVRKWIRRYEEEGIGGLLSKRSPGRPREVDPSIRREIVRLPKETRPPFDVGAQWSVRTLAEMFGVSPAYVSLVWREAGYDPPLHLQQVLRNPDREVTVDVRLTVPAWLRLHWELVRWEADAADVEDWYDLRAEVLPTLEERWTEVNERLPRVDPRRLDFDYGPGDEG